MHQSDRQTLNRIHSELHEVRLGIAGLRDDLSRMEKTMATEEQLQKLRTDIADLITAATDEITAAIEAAQNKSPDPAIDELDTAVATETQVLKDAAAALRAGKPVPKPVP